MSAFTEYLTDICRKMNISLAADAALQFEAYKDILIEWNNKINLTALTDERDIALRHFADSLTALRYADFAGKRVIDVGTGAGFPGLPIKLAVPAADVTLLDSLGKRVTFLNEVCSALALDGVHCVNMRAEEGALPKTKRADTLRGSFDICVSRAVAPLNILAELDLPYVRTGGIFMALKGPSAYDEVRAAQNAVRILGGDTPVIKETVLPDTDFKHTIVIIKKIKNTPDKYPRIYGKIKKNPL